MEPAADLNVKIDLETKEVAVQEDIMSYEVEILGRGLENRDSSQGTSILSAVTVGTPPAVCADQFVDLKWLVKQNALQELASDLIKQVVEYGH